MTGSRLAFLADRAVVLFLGAAVGAAIALAFVGGGSISAGLPGRVPPAGSKTKSTAPATAATALDCATPIPPRLRAAVREGRPVTIGVFGDSFGDGLWAALYRRMAKDPVKVVRLSEEGTGFTRYQTINLERRAMEQLRGQAVDVAVITIGANDTEGLFDDEHKHAYALMSPGWKSIYGARIDRFVTLIRDQGAMVYWVGLPKMRQPAYDRDIAALDAFVAERMAALRVPYLSTRGLSSDGAGEFSPYLADPVVGTPRLMRANDGVHMTAAGYERLAGPLIARIRTYIAQAASAEAPPRPLLAETRS